MPASSTSAPIETFPAGKVGRDHRASTFRRPSTPPRAAVRRHEGSSGYGRIINVASAHGLVASPFKSAYVAAKHGVVGLTKTLALEGAEHGITVNAICPGYV